MANLAAIAICGLALFWTLRLGYADWLFHDGSLQGAARAAQLALGNARYQAGWALSLGSSPTDSGAARAALESAVAANPRDASSWIELGLRAERRRDFLQAEHNLLQAARADKRYDPRWELANFYFRRDDRKNFWPWAQKAATMLYGDPAPLLELCWRMSPDPAVILNRVVPDRPPVLAGYLNFLLAGHHWDGVEPAAQRLIERAEPDDLPALFASCDRLLEAGRVNDAPRIWNSLCRRSLVPYPKLEPEKGLSLTNGRFLAQPISHGFDWRIDPPEGVSHSWSGAPPGVQIAFSGRQPERCEILSQLVPLLPGRRYRLRFRYTTSNIAPGTGLRWRIFDAEASTELAAVSPDLSSEVETQQELVFPAPARIGLARIVLSYQRTPGTTRIEGSVFLREVGLAFAEPQQEPSSQETARSHGAGPHPKR